jgi:hypothetical protein
MAEPEPTPEQQLLDRYAYWLHLEQRRLAQEMYPDHPGADRFVRVDGVATNWHLGREPSPPASSRAAAGRWLGRGPASAAGPSMRLLVLALGPGLHWPNGTSR